jgi:hypothetical protein
MPRSAVRHWLSAGGSVGNRSPVAALAALLLSRLDAEMAGDPMAVARVLGWRPHTLVPEAPYLWSLDGDAVGYRWVNDRRERNLWLAHGISASELHRSGLPDDARTVTLLTAELWFPRAAADGPVSETLRAQPYLPAWWAEARLAGLSGSGVHSSPLGAPTPESSRRER